MYPAVFLIYLICPAVIFLASLALVVRCAVPYNSAGMATVLCSCITVCVVLSFIGLNMLFIVEWPLVPKFAGSNPGEAVGFFGRKNPQHAFLRRGGKAVGPMS